MRFFFSPFNWFLTLFGIISANDKGYDNHPDLGKISECTCHEKSEQPTEHSEPIDLHDGFPHPGQDSVCNKCGKPHTPHKGHKRKRRVQGQPEPSQSQSEN